MRSSRPACCTGRAVRRPRCPPVWSSVTSPRRRRSAPVAATACHRAHRPRPTPATRWPCACSRRSVRRSPRGTRPGRGTIRAAWARPTAIRSSTPIWIWCACASPYGSRPRTAPRCVAPPCAGWPPRSPARCTRRPAALSAPGRARWTVRPSRRSSRGSPAGPPRCWPRGCWSRPAPDTASRTRSSRSGCRAPMSTSICSPSSPDTAPGRPSRRCCCSDDARALCN